MCCFTFEKCGAHAQLLCVAALWALALSPAGVGGVQLQFNSGGEFKIVQFADLHYGESDEQDARSDAFQLSLLSLEKPDLLVYSGDQVTGFFWLLLGRPEGWTQEVWPRVFAPAIEAGVPYAVVLGNHDAEADLSREEVIQLDMRTSNLSLTQRGPRQLSGAGNYWLDVVGPQGEVDARVWMLDSGDVGCGGGSEGWGCVEADTVAWAAQQAQQLPTVPTSLAFIHIPIPQFVDVFNQQPTNGSKHETVACSAGDSGIFEKLGAAGLQAVYSGHDHQNDFFGSMGGVRMAYGRKSGYGGYAPAEGQERGARVILLRLGESGAESETWIRGESGEWEEQPATEVGQKRDMMQAVCDGAAAGLY